MMLSHSKIIALTVILLIPLGYAVTEEEVADRVGIAVTELREKTVVKNLKEVPPVASKYLEGYTDAERIRGIAAWMDREKDARTRTSVPAYAGNMLTNDPDAIKDTSELRKLLATEEDPGRFFLLCEFSSYVPRPRDLFIPEMSRMLFRHGRVSPANNSTTYANVLGDVGAFTYEKIVILLKNRQAAFDKDTMLPHDGNIPYRQKIPILAKWLRANWPGCEHLGEGEALMAESGIEFKKPLPPAERPRKEFPAKVREAPAKATASKLWWLAITIGMIALAAFIVWRSRRSKVSEAGFK